MEKYRWSTNRLDLSFHDNFSSDQSAKDEKVALVDMLSDYFPKVSPFESLVTVQ